MSRSSKNLKYSVSCEKERDDLYIIRVFCLPPSDILRMAAAMSVLLLFLVSFIAFNTIKNCSPKQRTARGKNQASEATTKAFLVSFYPIITERVEIKY